MTCIVGIEYNDKVYMGSDGCASSSYNKFEYDEPKLFKLKNLLIGYTTSFRFADILKYHTEIPDHDGALSDKAYLVSCVVPAFRKALKEHGFSKIESNRESGGTALIGYNKKLYCLQDEYSIVRYLGGYDACGSGTYFALGSLHTTASLPLSLTPQARLEMALNAASTHGVGVSEPFHFEEI